MYDIIEEGDNIKILLKKFNYIYFNFLKNNFNKI